MKYQTRIWAVAALTLVSFASVHANENSGVADSSVANSSVPDNGGPKTAVPETIAKFRLPDVTQTMAEVDASQAKFTVVCFLGTECPLAQLYAPRLNQLSEKYADVKFVAINSNRQDSAEEVAAYAQKHGLRFPMLKDHRNEVADRFDARRTPEVFVLDPAGSIRYRGRIDDQYTPGTSRPTVGREDLRLAIEELLAGKPVSQPITEPAGCFIGRVRTPVAASDVTYCNQVVRILQKNCVECHRAGEIGPFELQDYDEVVGWADTIIEVIDDGRMPPWHANPAHGEFKNARHMSSSDKELLRTWVDAGMPFGDADQLPEPPNFTDGWRLPHEPDMVLSMGKTPFRVASEGTIEYQYFLVDPGFEKDMWVTGAQIVPGNSSVVHHSIVYVRPPDGTRFRGIGWLTAYVPGSRAGTFPDRSAIRVPAGSKLVFQQHYTPNGVEQTDMTKLGLTFGKDEDITHEVYTLVGIDQEFEIPPHAESYSVQGRVRYLPPHAQLLAVMPHMHLRGKSVRLFAESKGEQSVLLDVPHYDFNWQHSYEFKDPVPLSSIDDLSFDATFDNSNNNPANPDPSEFVTWGDQTNEEMAVVFYAVSEPREKPQLEKPVAATKPVQDSPEKLARMRAEADRILGKFDRNGDGVVTQFETPDIFRRRAFWEIDQDRNGELTRAEIEAAARRRVN